MAAVSYLGASVSPHPSPAWPCCTYSFWGQNKKNEKKKQGLQSFAAEHVAPQGANISERKLKIEGHMLHRHSDMYFFFFSEAALQG